MAFRKKATDPNTGKSRTGTVLDIVEASEPVARLKLEDGTIVRIKVGIIEVMRMDEQGPDGKDVYDINAQLTASFVLPEDQLDD